MLTIDRAAVQTARDNASQFGVGFVLDSPGDPGNLCLIGHLIAAIPDMPDLVEAPSDWYAAVRDVRSWAIEVLDPLTPDTGEQPRYSSKAESFVDGVQVSRTERRDRTMFLLDTYLEAA